MTKRQRFQDLRHRELERRLSEAEQSELASLTQELDDMESACLAPGMERLRQENTLLEAEAKRLTEQRKQLAELLAEKETYLRRVRALVEELETERLDLLDRFAHIVGEPLQEANKTTAVS